MSIVQRGCIKHAGSHPGAGQWCADVSRTFGDAAETRFAGLVIALYSLEHPVLRNLWEGTENPQLSAVTCELQLQARRPCKARQHFTQQILAFTLDPETLNPKPGTVLTSASLLVMGGHWQNLPSARSSYEIPLASEEGTYGIPAGA